MDQYVRPAEAVAHSYLINICTGDFARPSEKHLQWRSFIRTFVGLGLQLY